MGKNVEKSLRIDLLIALSALLVSTLTAAAALYQGRIIARQLSVTVWPYLAYRESVSNASVQFDVENVGAGPAIIGGASMSVDGKPQTSLAAALTALGFKRENGTALSLTSIQPGVVIRPGDSMTLVRVRSKRFAALAPALQRRLRVDVCYCSMLQQCWLKTIQSDVPSDVGSCDSMNKSEIDT